MRTRVFHTIPDDAKSVSEEGRGVHEGNDVGEAQNKLKRDVPFTSQDLACVARLRGQHIGAENSGERAGSGSLRVYMKMGGRGVGHPVIPRVSPSRGDAGDDAESELWGGKALPPPPLTLLTQTQPFIVLFYARSPRATLRASGPPTRGSGGAAT